MVDEKDDVVVEEVKEIDSSVVRNHTLFQKQTKLNSELKEKLAQYEAKEKNAEQERQMKLLEETGNFKILLEQKDAELKAYKDNIQKELTKERLSNALLQAGVSHPLALKLAVSEFDSSVDIAEYVSTIMQSEDYKVFFNSNEPAGNKGPSPVSPAKNSSVSWDQVKKDITSPSPQKQKIADQMVLDYMAKHNKMPW
jgi:hypothetical protein